MGFGTGLLVDLVLVQTLGVTSLLYIAIGYWSGRLRELRDPAHGLVPLAAGAAATALAGLGMAVIQFLLGVDAPVSLLLVQQIFITVLVNTLIALPVYSARAPGHPARRCPTIRAAGGAAPTRPAVSARCSVPPSGSGRSPARAAMTPPAEERRPPLTPQLALRVAIAASFALAMFAIIFFRLWFLQVLSGEQYLAQASENRVAPIAIPAPRGEIFDRNGNVLVAPAAGRRWRSRHPICRSRWPPMRPTRRVKDRVLYNRLAKVLGCRTKRERCASRARGAAPLADPLRRRPAATRCSPTQT